MVMQNCHNEDSPRVDSIIDAVREFPRQRATIRFVNDGRCLRESHKVAERATQFCTEA